MIRLPLLIRRARPVVAVGGILVWFTLRIIALFYQAPLSLSLLRMTVHGLDMLQTRIISAIAAQGLLLTETATLYWFFWTVIEDVMALGMLVTCYRVAYCLQDYTLQEWKDLVTSAVYEFAVCYIPVVRAAVQLEEDNFRKDTAKMLNKGNNDNDSNNNHQHNNKRQAPVTVLPDKGRRQHDILQELRTHAAEENKKWMSGKLSGTVYYQGSATTVAANENETEVVAAVSTTAQDPTTTNNNSDKQQQVEQPMPHSDFLSAVYSIYSSANPLHPGCWPKANQCEAEVIAMTGNLLHLEQQACGCVTSGGTESILLAVRAHLKYYGAKSYIRYPEIILGSTAHAAFYKACEIYGIRPVVLDCNDGDTYQLKAAQVRRRITSNTIMIVASAPCYPQGVVDEIAELSKVAIEYDIGLHVDACLGGFVLAFCDDAPVFDFRCPGVTSMSIDTHKYGYAAKGSSVVLYRTPELRHAQYFSYAQWSGGLYVTPTFAGSRPGALSVCAWASLLSIGQEGYRQRVQSIVQAVRAMANGVKKIPGLKLMTPDGTQFVLVSFGSDELDIYRIKDAMSAAGWSLNDLQYPAAIHLCVTLSVVPNVNEFLRDLRQAVEDVRKEGSDGAKKGTAGIYGTASSAPSGPVEHLLNVFTDMTLAP